MADGKPVLAILADDTFLHVGKPSVLVAHLAAEFAAAPPPVWEFYDGAGQRLELVRDANGTVTGFGPAAGAPSPKEIDRTLLVDRIDAFQARVQVQLTRSLIKPLALGESIDRDRIPRVGGELPDVLAALDALAGGPPEANAPNPGSWLHNAWHRLVG